MEFQIPNFFPAITELFIAAMALLLLLVSSFARSRAATISFYWSQVTLLVAGASHLWFMDGVDFTFGQMFFDDPFGDLLKAGACFAAFLVLLYGRRYLTDRRLETPEYYLLVLFAVLGIDVLISAGNLITIYIGLELLSLSSYALVAIDRDSARSTEAAMKYFVLGALASGLLLYGMSMVYGATQSLNIIDVARALYEQQANRTILLFGLVFLVAGIAFKLGVVPFHMWIPDVYQGAPTAVTLFVSSAPKLAAFAMAFRLLAVGLWDLADHWQRMLMFVGFASVILGNIAAIAQVNLKRMLAYSGISHMGFLVLGLMSGVINGDRGFVHNAYAASMFYALTYVLTTLGAFGIMLLMTRAGFEAENIADFKGLNKRSPWWAAMMAVVMFSMAGIPFFVGFFSKFFILQAIVAAGYLWLAVAVVLMSLIGAFYYLRIVRVMYFEEPADFAPIQAGVGVRSVLSLNVLAIAAIGIFPGTLMQVCVLMVQNSL
jgi:NADH-quinone oxidoreductase subunit N